MTRREKRLFLAMWLGIFSLVLAIKYSGTIFGAIQICGKILMPFIAGGIIAFIVNVPMNGIEKKLLKNSKIKHKRPLCILLSYCLIILVITIIVGTVVPQIVTAASDLFQKIPKALQNTEQWISTQNVEGSFMTEVLAFLQSTELNWKSIVGNMQGFLQSGFTSVAEQLIGATSSMIGMIAHGVIAFIFSIYVLAGKEKLQRQVNLMLRAYLPEKICFHIGKVAKLLYTNFSNFIKVQCLEACIFGMMFVVAMTICRLPYAVMIGVLLAFASLLPIIGSFIGCIIGTLMILIISPVKAAIFIVLFIVIQQVEGNLIYPRTVGNAVGLPAMWTLAAVSIGGSLFGVAGMLAFIPLFSTAYALLKENVYTRTNKHLKQ